MYLAQNYESAIWLDENVEKCKGKKDGRTYVFTIFTVFHFFFLVISVLRLLRFSAIIVCVSATFQRRVSATVHVPLSYHNSSSGTIHGTLDPYSHSHASLFYLLCTTMYVVLVAIVLFSCFTLKNTDCFVQRAEPRYSWWNSIHVQLYSTACNRLETNLVRRCHRKTNKTWLMKQEHFFSALQNISPLLMIPQKK